MKTAPIIVFRKAKPSMFPTKTNHPLKERFELNLVTLDNMLHHFGASLVLWKHPDPSNTSTQQMGWQ